MAIFRKIHTKFWSDPFIQSLTPEKKYFFLYLLTNEKTKQCGIYEITTREISFDTGYNIETVLALLDFFISMDKIMFSRETNEVAVKNWNRYNDSKSPGVKDCVRKEIKNVKNQQLVQWVHSGVTVGTLPSQEEEEKEKEKEEEGIGSEVVRNIANDVWKDQIWKEQMVIGLRLKNIEELKGWLAMFNSSVSADRVENFNKYSYKKMSRGWILKQMSNGVKAPAKEIIRSSDSAPLTTLNNGI